MATKTLISNRLRYIVEVDNIRHCVGGQVARRWVEMYGGRIIRKAHLEATMTRNARRRFEAERDRVRPSRTTANGRRQ